MKDVLIEVRVPGAGRNFAVKVSAGLKIHELNGMFKNMFDNLTDEDFNTQGAVLCDARTGEILDINKTVAQTGLLNGSVLLLI